MLTDAKIKAAMPEQRARGRLKKVLILDEADLYLKVGTIEAERTPTWAALPFAECSEAYIGEHRADWKNPKSEAAWTGTLATYALPTIGTKDAASITTADVLECVKPIWLSKHSTAANVRSRIECILDWATAHGHRPDGDNPASWRRLRHLLPDASRVAKVEHHAALHYDQVAGFMADLAAIDSLPAKALRFTVLTAVRTDEARCVRWRDIDLKVRTWTILNTGPLRRPRMKAVVKYVPLLSGDAVEILMSLRTEQTEPDDYVFAQPHGQPFNEAAMLRLAKSLRPDTRLTVHGFRSCFQDWAGNEAGVNHLAVEAALGHKAGSDVEKSFRGGHILKARRALMDAWANFLYGRRG
jgi:integrase